MTSSPGAQDESVASELLAALDHDLEIVMTLSERVHSRAQAVGTTVTLALAIATAVLPQKTDLIELIRTHKLEGYAWWSLSLLIASLIFAFAASWPLAISAVRHSWLKRPLASKISFDVRTADELLPLRMRIAKDRVEQYRRARRALLWHSRALLVSYIALVAGLIVVVLGLNKGL